MPSAAEIAYRESVRALDAQAQDLDAIRGRVSILLSAGGLAAAVFGARVDSSSIAFVVAVTAFAVIAAVTVSAFWPVEFA